MQHVISFSGGQTSGYMLRRLMDNHADFHSKFMVLFCNTGKEHDKTLDFVHDVETQWGVNVTWLEYTRVLASSINPKQVPEGRKRTNLAKQAEAGETTHWFRVVNDKTAKRDNEPGPFDELLGWQRALPNVRGRSCSSFLKIRTMARFLHASGIDEWIDAIGIRADEAHRATEILANIDDKGETPTFPLIEDGITVRNVNDFWAASPFRLNIPNHEGNCRGCFLKASWKREAFARNSPLSAQWWLDQEGKMAARGITGDGAQWISGKSYAGIIAMANHPDLFSDPKEQDVPCSCAVGGYRGNEEAEE